VRGLKADLEDAATVETLSAAGGGPRLYLLLGNSLGILNPLHFLRTLRGLLRPEDLLLLDGEIYDDASLQGYDNPVNRRFAFAPSRAWASKRVETARWSSKTRPTVSAKACTW